MDPLGSLTSIGSPASSRLSFYLLVQVASILLPGVILLTELSVLAFHFVPHPGSDIDFVAAETDSVSGAALIVFVCVGLAASFVIGRISRGVALWIGVLLEPLWRTMSVMVKPDWARVQSLLGTEASSAVIRSHPIIRQILAAPSSSHRNLFGYGNKDATIDVVDYCKLWLRRCGSTTGVDFSVDHFEVEINIVGAMCFPVVFLGIDAIIQPDVPLWVDILFGIITITGALTVLALSVFLRAHECWQALRNVAFAQAMDRADNIIEPITPTGDAADTDGAASKAR